MRVSYGFVGSEADGEMKPDAIVRGAMKMSAAALAFGYKVILNLSARSGD